jgi:hypothetical protein
MWAFTNEVLVMMFAKDGSLRSGKVGKVKFKIKYTKTNSSTEACSSKFKILLLLGINSTTNNETTKSSNKDQSKVEKCTKSAISNYSP